VEGIAFAGELAQQPLKGKDEGRMVNDESKTGNNSSPEACAVVAAVSGPAPSPEDLIL
jgi:hypothetical protein